jgi:uncharacterized protein DUF3551
MRTLILTAALSVAAMVAAPQAASAQSQGRYCLRSPTGAVNCTYDSFRQCQQSRGGRSVGGGCVRNPALVATTGRGGTSRAARQPVPPGPPGGGQFLASPTRSEALATTGRGGTSRAARQRVPAGPPGGGQFLPPQTR